MDRNLLTLTDSYKNSHPAQFPKGLVNAYLYGEARSQKVYSHTLFVGLSYIIIKYISKEITIENIDDAEDLAKAHGVPFNRSGWYKVWRDYNGILPLTIKAVPEGTLVPNGNVLFTVELTKDDEELAWLPSWCEDLLMKVWYMCNVATRSYYVKKMLLANAKLTEDVVTPEMVDFMFHNFGDRGASSVESAGIGGMAHLMVFKGTDNFNSLKYMDRYYDSDLDTYMPAGFSIPASEHATTTSWGKDREFAMGMNHLEVHKAYPFVASVGDSYDIINFTNTVTSGDFLLKIESDEYPTFVIRPDSDDPRNVIPEILNIMEANNVQYTLNKKGYKLLNKYRIIWGDGIDMQTMQDVLSILHMRKYSILNQAFGSGGWLMQQHDRDTLGFAIKMSNAKFADGTELEVYKKPIGDASKESKRGRVTLWYTSQTDSYFTALEGGETEHLKCALETVYCDGKIKHYKYTDIRDRVNASLAKELNL